MTERQRRQRARIELARERRAQSMSAVTVRLEPFGIVGLPRAVRCMQPRGRHLHPAALRNLTAEFVCRSKMLPDALDCSRNLCRWKCLARRPLVGQMFVVAVYIGTLENHLLQFGHTAFCHQGRNTTGQHATERFDVVLERPLADRAPISVVMHDLAYSA